MRLLKEAVNLDALHFPAHSNLLIALVANSELAEARERAGLVKALFPESALPAFVEVLLGVIERDRDAVGRHLDELRRRLGPSKAAEVAALQLYCEELIKVMAHVNKARVESAHGFKFGDYLQLGLEVQRLKTLAPHDMRPMVVPMPTVGLLFEVFESSLAAIQFGTSQGHDAAFRRLMLLHEKNPEALILATAAAELLQMAREKIDHPDLRPCRKLFQEMADLSERAARSPTLLVDSPVRYQSQVLTAIADVSLLKITPGADPRHAARIRDHLHAMIADGRRWPEDRREGLNALLMMIVADLTQDQARDWNLATPEGASPGGKAQAAPSLRQEPRRRLA